MSGFFIRINKGTQCIKNENILRLLMVFIIKDVATYDFKIRAHRQSDERLNNYNLL